MKYSPTAAALPQPPGSRNQENRHIRLSVLKAAVLVPPQGLDSHGHDSHRKHQWGRYFQAKLEEPSTTDTNKNVRMNLSKSRCLQLTLGLTFTCKFDPILKEDENLWIASRLIWFDQPRSPDSSQTAPVKIGPLS
ncbi:hypothetical protein STEG23_014578 [Scotinomys teguina]